MVSQFEIEDANQKDGLMLAELRARAMKPSLESIGRFDEDRVRSRFLKDFKPSDTRKITVEGKTIGFYVVRCKEDHLYLDHLYVETEFQGTGIGTHVVNTIKKSAASRGLPIRLGGLRGSRANAFYRACGFTVSHEDEFDIYYEWMHS